MATTVLPADSEDLFDWLEEQESCCPPEGPLNKAINYILNRRDELSRFLGDGAVPLDNNTRPTGRGAVTTSTGGRPSATE